MEFVFGIDAMPNLVALASQLESRAWKRLKRAPAYEREGPERARPPQIKEQIVRDRGFKNLRLISEDVTDVTYRPTACRQEYRLVIVRKNLSVERGEHVLFDDVRYFFYLTNDWSGTAAQIVFDANDRCDQENLIAQLKSGVRALRAPVGDLESNGAYMAMASLAWTLKAWFALLLPETGRFAKAYAEQKRRVLRMEFRSFVNAFMRSRCRSCGRGVVGSTACSRETASWMCSFVAGISSPSAAEIHIHEAGARSPVTAHTMSEGHAKVQINTSRPPSSASPPSESTASGEAAPSLAWGHTSTHSGQRLFRD
jgi:hypothetical protein